MLNTESETLEGPPEIGARCEVTPDCFLGPVWTVSTPHQRVDACRRHLEWAVGRFGDDAWPVSVKKWLPVGDSAHRPLPSRVDGVDVIESGWTAEAAFVRCFVDPVGCRYERGGVWWAFPSTPEVAELIARFRSRAGVTVDPWEYNRAHSLCRKDIAVGARTTR